MGRVRGSRLHDLPDHGRHPLQGHPARARGDDLDRHPDRGLLHRGELRPARGLRCQRAAPSGQAGQSGAGGHDRLQRLCDRQHRGVRPAVGRGGALPRLQPARPLWRADRRRDRLRDPLLRPRSDGHHRARGAGGGRSGGGLCRSHAADATASVGGPPARADGGGRDPLAQRRVAAAAHAAPGHRTGPAGHHRGRSHGLRHCPLGAPAAGSGGQLDLLRHHLCHRHRPRRAEPRPGGTGRPRGGDPDHARRLDGDGRSAGVARPLPGYLPCRAPP